MPLQQARLRISDYNQKRKGQIAEKNKKVMAVSLSLTSMVDMFAILVIFLLLNTSSTVEWVKVGHNISLPKAKAHDETKKATTVSISNEAIFGDDTSLATTKQISSGALIIAPLKKWLQSNKDPDEENHVNVVGDENVPFGAVRRVIATVQDSGFKKVNLAVAPRN